MIGNVWLGGGRIGRIFDHCFEEIISVENLLEAWREFLCGKRGKHDVQEFGFMLMDNILDLHTDLANHTYRHGLYHEFNINDPKPRRISKALVRDRLLHHAVYRVLYPYFDPKFIADSYSCRLHKGTHRAMNRFRTFAYKVSQNNMRKSWLEELLPRVGDFLQEHLNLNLHPNKVSIQTLASGVDFLGWVHFPDHRVLRTTTKRRMFKRLAQNSSDETIASYRGLLKHGNTIKLANSLPILKP